MSRRFQAFDHRKTPYNRPTEAWHCAYAAEGRPCPQGPDAKGQCQLASECRPRRNGTTWVCSRPGQPCREGPTLDGACTCVRPPCTPQPSLRTLRGRLGFWVTATVLSILLVSFASTQNMLSIPAGQRIKGHGELTNCGACHVVFDSGNWLLAAFRQDDALADSRKCTACHDRGEAALRPHSLPKHELQSLTLAASARNWHAKPTRLESLRQEILPLPAEVESGIACSVCHIEHMGAAFDVTAVSNARCQSCHEIQFRSFAEGHPSFENYPYLRRTRIVFDHQAHFARNFAEAKVEGAPRRCADCHTPDPTEQFVLVKPFEETCAACHAKDIKGQEQAGSKGIPVLTVPGLDLPSLRRAGIDIGQWPAAAPGGSISPFMKLTIAADNQLAADLARLETLNLMALERAGPEDLAAVRRVAWAIKDLVYDFVVAGPEKLNARVAHTLGHHLDEATQGDMVAKVPLDAVLAAREAWFPDLEREILQRRLGQVVKGPAPLALPSKVTALEAEVDSEAWSEFGGWFRKGFTLYYRPNEHRDPFVRSWLDIAARSQGTAAQHHGQDLLTHFRTKDAPGQCTRCHSLEQDSEAPHGGRLHINWRPFTPDPGHSSFTAFDHASHFRIVGERGCGTCHRINAAADYAGSFKNFDAGSFQSNFAPIGIEVCADCHVRESVGNDCIQCHRYHVGEFPAVPVETPIREPSAGASPVPEQGTATFAGAAQQRAGEQVQVVQIRLSSHRSKERAHQELTNVQGAFAGLLGDKQLFIDQQAHGDKARFYRLIVSPFDDIAAAEATCQALHARHQDCFVMEAGHGTPEGSGASWSLDAFMQGLGLAPPKLSP